MHLLGGERVGTAQNQVRRSIYSFFPGDPQSFLNMNFISVPLRAPDMGHGSTVAQNGQTEVKLWFLGCLGHHLVLVHRYGC